MRPPFSFAWLEECIVEHVQDTDDAAMTWFERYAMIGVVAAGALAIMAYVVLRNAMGLRILQYGVVLQWVCVVLLCIRLGYRAWHAYKRQYKDFARDLDDIYVPYRNIVTALRAYPAAEITQRLRYVRDRKATLTYRHALLSGGMEKIGILPLLALMYLQLKDWSFGNWKDLLDHVHLVGSVLLWMLLMMYLAAWWGARIKGRLDLYEALLTEAGVGNEEEGGGAG